MPRLAIAVVCLALTATPALAAGPEDADSAVALATNAFEYRDFRKVIDVLTPWLHPPRITNREKRIVARRLLGISLHVEGDVPAAREEFSQLLIEDPAHKLDPFVVPPPVIETFEAVRREMKPTLDRILHDRGQRSDPDEPPNRALLVPIGNPFVALLPGGLPQFQLDQPVRGTAFLVVQVLALSGNVFAFLRARAIAHDAAAQNPPLPPENGPWIAAQYGCLSAFVVTYAVSVVLGTLQLGDYNRTLLREEPKSTSPPGSLIYLTF